MKLVILGANGQTGKELVKLALQDGHQVTAVTRTPEAIVPVTNLTVVKADIFDNSALEKVFKGHDAVLSTLGSFKSKPIEPSSKAIVEAMQSAKVKRLIVELSFGAVESARLSKPMRTLMDVMLGAMLEDQKLALQP